MCLFKKWFASMPLLFVFSPPVGAQLSFVTVDAPASTSTQTYGINNRGDQVGGYEKDGVNRAFLLSNGVYKDIVPPWAVGHMGSLARSINDAGRIVGSYWDQNVVEHGFSYNGGAFTAIDYPGAAWSSAEYINNRGQIVGAAGLNGQTTGYLLNGSTFTGITYPGAIETIPGSISDAGVIAGRSADAQGVQHGFTLTGTTYRSIDVPIAGYQTRWLIRNSSGQFGGILNNYVTNMFEGYLLSKGVLSIINVPGAAAGSSQVIGINDAGQVVGMYIDTHGVVHGYIGSPTNCIFQASHSDLH